MANSKIFWLTFLFVSCFYTVFAQEDTRLTVRGIVTDANSGEPIPFANIGVLGTFAGVASDMEGEFELLLPKRYTDHVIRFSVVGYARYDIKVSEAAGQEVLKVSLQPISYKIDEVEVKAKSLVFIRMLKQVVANIGKNYVSHSYSYNGYFEYTISRNDNRETAKEAVVTIYDSKGYVRSDVETAFKEVNYTFNEVRRSNEPRSVYDKLTYFDDVITADMVRNTRNVLDIVNIDEFEITDKGRILYEEDSVQLIGYEVKKPSISNSGEAGVTKYSGRIYVNLSDYAVLKNEMYITAANYNILGRNLIVTDSVNANKPVEMVISTNYKKLHERYILSGVNISYTYKEGNDVVDGKMTYVTTRVNMDAPQVVNGRMYYEEVKDNPRFWSTYTVYMEE